MKKIQDILLNGLRGRKREMVFFSSLKDEKPTSFRDNVKNSQPERFFVTLVENE